MTTILIRYLIVLFGFSALLVLSVLGSAVGVAT